jgi:hypothetical protein
MLRPGQGAGRRGTETEPRRLVSRSDWVLLSVTVALSHDHMLDSELVLGASGIVVSHCTRYDSEPHHDIDSEMLVSENSIQCRDAPTRSASSCRRGSGAGTVGGAGNLEAGVTFQADWV